jgi:hypothetical protein
VETPYKVMAYRVIIPHLRSPATISIHPPELLFEVVDISAFYSGGIEFKSRLGNMLYKKLKESHNTHMKAQGGEEV